MSNSINFQNIRGLNYNGEKIETAFIGKELLWGAQNRGYKKIEIDFSKSRYHTTATRDFKRITNLALKEPLPSNTRIRVRYTPPTNSTVTGLGYLTVDGGGRIYNMNYKNRDIVDIEVILTLSASNIYIYHDADRLERFNDSSVQVYIINPIRMTTQTFVGGFDVNASSITLFTVPLAVSSGMREISRMTIDLKSPTGIITILGTDIASVERGSSWGEINLKAPLKDIVDVSHHNTKADGFEAYNVTIYY